MTPSTTPEVCPPVFDPIDAAFLSRASRPVTAAGKVAVEQPTPSHVATAPAIVPSPSVDDGEGIVARLLAAAPDQWCALADLVERACRGQCRVVAVAGGSRGEGRTTVVEGLVATLQARGRRVARIRDRLPETGGPLFASDGERPEIVILDAGIWFPPGPIHRRRVSLASLGCDAVILVRRAAEPPCPARGDVLDQIGLRVLGEVETFATPADDTGNSSP